MDEDTCATQNATDLDIEDGRSIILDNTNTQYPGLFFATNEGSYMGSFWSSTYALHLTGGETQSILPHACMCWRVVCIHHRYI